MNDLDTKYMEVTRAMHHLLIQYIKRGVVVTRQTPKSGCSEDHQLFLYHAALRYQEENITFLIHELVPG